ncbi:MAG: hypothetical protein U5K29_13365 [Acidimicrobiales bacterium]|nr:hypothetical protein [Acidimicrobiales bacterium]
MLDPSAYGEVIVSSPDRVGNLVSNRVLDVKCPRLTDRRAPKPTQLVSVL